MNVNTPMSFLHPLERHPREIALIDDSRSLSWAAVAEELGRIANALETLGLRDRCLGVLGRNNADTVLVYAAAIIAGVDVVLLNVHLSPREVAYLLDDSGADAVWTSPDLIDTATDAVGVTTPVLSSGEDSMWARSIEASAPVLPSLDSRAGRELVYTSGTTGLPKAVELRASADDTVSVSDRLSHFASHHSAGLGRHLVAGPLYHVGPHAAVGLLLAGTAIVVPTRFDPARTLDLIGGLSVASSVMVPTHFIRMLALPTAVRERAVTSSLRLVTHTGSRCPTDVKRKMINWFGPVLRESYGASESGVISSITTEEWLARPGSVGRVAHPFEPLVLDADLRPVPAGCQGQLYFRDSTGRGISYRNDPVKTAAAHLEPGVFTLGDVGHVDRDGFLFVTGRVTDMVISGGVNIYPAECERVLREFEDVTDAAVFGVPDHEMGERLVGIVVAADPNLTAEELMARCRGLLAHYKIPRELRLVLEIPRNEMGKPDKAALEAAYAVAESRMQV